MNGTASRIVLGLTTLVGAVALAACTASGSADVHGSTVARSTIEQTASQQISARLGGGKYTVTCPHDLAAKPGAAMTCVTTFPDGEKFNGIATVTSVSGGSARWKYTPSATPA
jgi:hypothetical protein